MRVERRGLLGCEVFLKSYQFAPGNGIEHLEVCVEEIGFHVANLRDLGFMKVSGFASGSARAVITRTLDSAHLPK